MNFQQRKEVLIHLGKFARLFGNPGPWPGYGSGITEEEHNQYDLLVKNVHQHNGWFTESNVRSALTSWGKALEAENIEKWLNPYNIRENTSNSQIVGIIGAGNLPFVALHDIISVVASGHTAKVKLSSDDDLLIPGLFGLLSGIFPGITEIVSFTGGKLEKPSAVIATGSNNSSRYFEYYFRDIPHIIRKNRNSVAVLTGTESAGQLMQLGHDIFDYFGLGCRNVTKLYVPAGYDFKLFFEAIFPFGELITHNKYANNYDYNKAVWLLNRESLLDNSFILLKEDKQVSSPTASLYYEFYDDKKVVEEELAMLGDQLQCITGEGHMEFGTTQCPMLWDYADGVDTMSFLLGLKG